MVENKTETSQGNWRKQIINLSKWAWMLAVLVAFALYFASNFSEILGQVSRVPTLFLLLSFVLAMLGRLFLIGMSHELLVFLGYPKRYKSLFYIASSTELGKYLPGGVWHLLGRGTYYRSLDIPLKTTGQLVLLENLWSVAASGMSAALLLIAAYFRTELLIIYPILLLLWWLILYLWVGRQKALRVLLQVGLQALTWLIYGASFAVIIPLNQPSEIFLAMGAFALSWLIGFVTLFAPGGLGVREAALVAFLLPIMPSSEILIFALVHRLLWILVELLFGLIAWIFLDLH